MLLHYAKYNTKPKQFSSSVKQTEWRYFKNVYVYHVSPLTTFTNNMHKEGKEKLPFFTPTPTFFLSSFVHANWNNFVADIKAEEKTLSAPWKFQSLLIIDLDSYLKALLGPTYKIEVKK